jgi:DnaJ-class molecular chaperone
MSNHAAMSRAQQRYDDMAPPEDGPSECPDCDGSGYITTSDGQGNHDDEECPTCKGFGLLDDSGQPHDPDAAERDACDYYDRLKDEQLTGD